MFKEIMFWFRNRRRKQYLEQQGYKNEKEMIEDMLKKAAIEYTAITNNWELNESEWEKINDIILNNNEKPEYCKNLTEIDKERARLILNNSMSYPDHENTVANSGDKLRINLKKKYVGLSDESIDKITNKFMFAYR